MDQDINIIVYLGKNKRAGKSPARVVEAFQDEYIIVKVGEHSLKLIPSSSTKNIYEGEIFTKYIWCEFLFERDFIVRESAKRPKVKPQVVRVSRSGLPRKFKT